MPRLGVLVALIASALLALLPASPAAAHAQVSALSPQSGSVLAEAPADVSVTFNEPVTGARVSLRGSDGSQVEGSMAHEGPRVAFVPTAELPDGGYVFAWEAVSTDTHVVSGAVSFAVGDGAPPPAPEHLSHGSGSGVRAVHHLLTFAAAAALTARSQFGRRLALAAAVLAVVAGATRFAAMSDLAREVASQSLALQVLAAVLLGCASMLRGPRSTVVATLGIAALGSAGLFDGHAMSLDGVLPRMLHASHLTAAALWTGGVLALALEPDRKSALRFARVATPAVLVLLLAGSWNAFALGWPGGSDWSSAFNVKMAFFFLAAVSGLVNHVLLRRGGGDVPRGGISMEAAALLTVAVLSASLSSSAPPVLLEQHGGHAESAADVLSELDLGSGWVAYVSHPAARGGAAALVTVVVRDGAGAPFEGEVTMSLTSADGMVVDIEVSRFPGGSFSRVVWPTKGAWEWRLDVREDVFSRRRVSWPVEVG